MTIEYDAIRFVGMEKQAKGSSTANDNDRAEFRVMTYGELPDQAEFVRDTAEHYPYPMELVGEDRAVVSNLSIFGQDGISGRVVIRPSSEYAHKLSVTVLDAAAMHLFLEELAEAWESGSEEAGDLASAILGTLGYEWV